MRLAIQSRGSNAAGVLLVDLLVSRPDNWISPHQTSVTPAMVKNIIRQALAAGWTPSNAATFPFQYGIIRDKP